MKCYFCAILNQMCKNRMEQEHQFIDYIEQSIIKNWDKDALTDYKGITLQYKDVARKIAKFHIVLESAGIQPGDKIAVCGRNSAHWGVTFLATITYGAVIVPILHAPVHISFSRYTRFIAWFTFSTPSISIP